MKEFFLGLWLSISALFTGAPVEPVVGANSTISNLTSLSSADSNDLFPIVDTSAGQTKQITFSNATGSMKTFLDATYSPKAGGTSITTLGTVTAGTWNASTLTVPYGGTGSTTLSSNRLFVGNGTGNLISIGQGTSGQFLTSNGAGVAPSFTTAAIDQAGTYVWTGLHTFNASTTLSATTSIDASNVNSNALILNTLGYAFPTSRGASSTVLTEDGSGNLRWYLPTHSVIYRSTGSSTVSNTATTTALTVTIPAGVMGANGTIRSTAYICTVGGGSQHKYEVAFGDGSSSSTLAQFGQNSGNTGDNIQTTIMNYTATAQKAFSIVDFSNGSGIAPIQRTGRASPAVNTAAKSYLAFRAGEGASGVETGFCGVLVELIRTP